MMKNRLRVIFKWLYNDFKWPLLILIPVVACLINFLAHQDFLGWSANNVLKSKLEIIHPALLAGFALVSLMGWRMYSSAALGGMAWLGFAFVMREIHFEGSDYLMGVIVVIVLGSAWRSPERYVDLWNSDWVVSLLFMGFVSYFCSEILLDRGLIKQPFELLYGDPDWKLPFSTQMEESLETLGGLFLFLSGLIFFRAKRKYENRE
jgi:hypothetical protein